MPRVVIPLHQRFADAWGLALAAGPVLELVEERTPEPELRVALHELRTDALETQARCRRFAEAEPEADELRAHAQSRKSRAGELALPWFKAGTTAVEAWTFLAMAEAGEVAAWSSVARIAADANRSDLHDLAQWAVGLQRQHLAAALEGVEQATG